MNDDAISRQAANARIKAICEKYHLSYEDGERKPATGGSAYALGHAFDDLPPAVPKGDWIKWNFKTFGAMGDWEYKCSNCGKVYDGEYNFCPNCGADMREEGKA